MERQAIDRISEEEWNRLPYRARLLINAGFVDPQECIEGWRRKWQEEEVNSGEASL